MSGSHGDLSPPEKLHIGYDLSSFHSGEETLDDCLPAPPCSPKRGRRSLPHLFVCAGTRVIGYYTLAVGAAAHASASGRVKRNMPDPVPVMVLGRLAVDRSFQGRGIGAAVLRDAVLRTLQAADIAGIRAILVHAISEDAKRFYERSGLSASPIDPLTLMVTVRDAARELA